MPAYQWQRAQLLSPASGGSPILRTRGPSAGPCAACLLPQSGLLEANLHGASLPSSQALCPTHIKAGQGSRPDRHCVGRGARCQAPRAWSHTSQCLHNPAPGSAPAASQRQPPRIVGVDDWAVRKGRTYGSILVNLERRKPIELLPDRTASTFSARLRRHPDIRIIARDRSSEYARGAATATKVIQVAHSRDGDRWLDAIVITRSSDRDHRQH
ncbi:transposase family protein [Microvirga lotononidis]|uniref:Transposase family protein n=1 Tax=Microvirga lotononidis TaxID=864069 RepID=I4Z323_9HYPH|nr:transposase family protein [Microvirga lotononidis]